MTDEKKTVKTAENIEKIRELVEMMADNNLVEVEIIDGDNKVYLRRPEPQQPQQVITQVPMATAPMQAMPAAMPVAPQAAVAPAAQAGDDDLAEIFSPIVGTFYTAPSPDSDPYIKVGDRVTADTVVCIVEAMKVMNEIKAELSGTVEKVCVSNGEAVEFGQALFKVKPE